MLKSKIKEMNNQVSPYHKLSREEDYIKHLSIDEYDNETFVAGLVARMYWSCMYIDTLFVDEKSRGTGLGRRLMLKTIEIACSHKCKFIVLSTYSFQARGFYEKFGFRVIGEIEDYPPGESFYTMRKDL